MSRVFWFEIPTDDPEMAAKFYSDIFGWKIKKLNATDDYWLIITGKMKNLVLMGL